MKCKNPRLSRGFCFVARTGFEPVTSRWPAMSPREVMPRQAGAVMAFGQETGRVLSDGRIVGRAEPFAKVFASSRLVKQAVGLTAWGILEDIALDATLDVEGRLVAETSARRIADNLGLNKETVTRHLGRLRDFGFVLHEEVRHHGSGRWETARYVLDPSACLERFTTTPRPRQNRSSDPCTEKPDTVNPVSGKAGHGATGHGESGHQQQDVVASLGEQQQQTAAALAELLALGIDDQTARSLVARHSPARIHDVAAAAPRRANRNQAGWAVRALEGGWALDTAPPPRPAAAPVPPPTPDIVVAADDAIDDAVAGPMAGLGPGSLRRAERRGTARGGRGLVRDAAGLRAHRARRARAADPLGSSRAGRQGRQRPAACPPRRPERRRETHARRRRRHPGRRVRRITGQRQTRGDTAAMASGNRPGSAPAAGPPRRGPRPQRRPGSGLTPHGTRAGRSVRVTVQPYQTPEFQNSAEFTIVVTFVVAGGARPGTAAQRAARIFERIANHAARLTDVVALSATAGHSSEGQMSWPQRVRFAAANVETRVSGGLGKLSSYVHPDRQQAKVALAAANTAARARRDADQRRRASAGCTTPTAPSSTGHEPASACTASPTITCCRSRAGILAGRLPAVSAASACLWLVAPAWHTATPSSSSSMTTLRRCWSSPPNEDGTTHSDRAPAKRTSSAERPYERHRQRRKPVDARRRP